MSVKLEQEAEFRQMISVGPHEEEQTLLLHVLLQRHSHP